jgi:hypothetical protein
MSTPPAGSLPLLRWAQVPLSIPYRPVSPACKLQAKAKKQDIHPLSIMCPTTSGSRPSRSEGLRCSHMSCSSGPCPSQEGPSAAMSPTAPNPTSLVGRAPEPPCIPRLWIPPTCSGGLPCHRVSHSYLTRP